MDADSDAFDRESVVSEDDASSVACGDDSCERPPPIQVPPRHTQRSRSSEQCTDPGSSCSTASPRLSATTGTPTHSSHARAANDLRSDRELVRLVCSSSTNRPESCDVLDLSSAATKTRKTLKSLNALADFSNLVQLNVSNHAISSVDGIDAFVQLQVLTMARNHLKRIGSALFALTSLRYLDLSGNFLSHIPKAIMSLEQLETLRLAGNNLSVLKEVDPLSALANLHECSFTANPFCKLPTYRDYIVCKLPSLEKLDDAVITALVRDKSRRRFSDELFSKDSRLREAGRAHEHEQSKLRDAHSALEAENLRLKGELQVKSKLLQNKSKEWSSATGQLLQLQQEIAMLNLDSRSSSGGAASPGRFASLSSDSSCYPNNDMDVVRSRPLSASFSGTSSSPLRPNDARLSATSTGYSSALSSPRRLSGSFTQHGVRHGRSYSDDGTSASVVTVNSDDIDVPLQLPQRSASPTQRVGVAHAAVSPICAHDLYAQQSHPQPQSQLRSSSSPHKLSLSGQFDAEVAAASASCSPLAYDRREQRLGEREDMSSYSQRLIESAGSPLRRNTASAPDRIDQSSSPDKPTATTAATAAAVIAATKAASENSNVRVSTSHDVALGLTIDPHLPIAPAAASTPGRSKSFDAVRRAFINPSPERRDAAAMESSFASPLAQSTVDARVDLADDDAMQHDLRRRHSTLFPTFVDDVACPAYEDRDVRHSNNSSGNNSVLRERPSVDPSVTTSYAPLQQQQYHVALSPRQQRQLTSPPRSPAQRQWQRQHDAFRDATFGRSAHNSNSSSSPSKLQRLQAAHASSPIDREMLAQQIQALQSCKQSLVTEIANEEQLLHALKHEAKDYADQIDQLHLDIQVVLNQDSAVAAASAASGLPNAGASDDIVSPRARASSERRQREEASYRAKLECCRAKLRFAEDNEREIEMTMVRTTKRVLQSDDRAHAVFDKEIFALTHKLQLVIVQKEEIHQEMSRLLALARDQSQQLENSSSNGAGSECPQRRTTSTSSTRGGSSFGSNAAYEQQTVDDMLEEEEQRQRLSVELQQSVAFARKRLDELQRRHRDTTERIQIKQELLASLVHELQDVEKELALISQRIAVAAPVAAAPVAPTTPLGQARVYRSASLDFHSSYHLPSASTSSEVMTESPVPLPAPPVRTPMDAIELELAEALEAIKERRVGMSAAAYTAIAAAMSSSDSSVRESDAQDAQTRCDERANAAAAAVSSPSSANADARNQDPLSAASAATTTAAPAVVTERSTPPLLPQHELKLKELLTAEVLEAIKKDIYERLATQLATVTANAHAHAIAATAVSAATGHKQPDALDHTALHNAIAAALESQMTRAIESFHKQQQQRDDDARDKTTLLAATDTQRVVPLSSSPVKRLAHRTELSKTAAPLASSTARTTAPSRPLEQHWQQQPQQNQNQQLQPPGTDAPRDDDIACDELDDFVPVDATYDMKYRFHKHRAIALNGPSPSPKSDSKASTRAASVQRILKACERLEAAETECRIDAISRIELDPLGNKRSSLHVLLMAARDLPTAHLRTKNLDPYVRLEIVYPDHMASMSPNNASLRSRTIKKSVYPIWDEEFAFAPVASLKGVLHVRILNDRKLSREQLVGEVRIPLRTLLSQKKSVEWFPLRFVAPSTAPATTSGGTHELLLSGGSSRSKTRRTTQSTVLRLSGGFVRLQLQLSYSRIEKAKRTVDDLVTKFVLEFNQLPPFIEAAAMANGGTSFERVGGYNIAKRTHNQEQHEEQQCDNRGDDCSTGDGDRASASSSSVPEMESPGKGDVEPSMPSMLTFDAWRIERSVEAAAAYERHQHQQRARDRDAAAAASSTYNSDAAPLRTPNSTSVAIRNATSLSSTGGTSLRLSAARSEQLWAVPAVIEQLEQQTVSYERASNVSLQASSNRLRHTAPVGSSSALRQQAIDTSDSTMLQRRASRQRLRSSAGANATAAAANGHAAAQAQSLHPASRHRRLSKTTQHRTHPHKQHLYPHEQHQRHRRPECFDDYSPYHPNFQCLDVMDYYDRPSSSGNNGSNDAYATTNRLTTGRIGGATVWQAHAHNETDSKTFAGLDAAEATRKTDLRIFKSPGFARRQPSTGFPERYIGLDNQTCERLKRMFGRMDSSGGSSSSNAAG